MEHDGSILLLAGKALKLEMGDRKGKEHALQKVLSSISQRRKMYEATKEPVYLANTIEDCKILVQHCNVSYIMGQQICNISNTSSACALHSLVKQRTALHFTMPCTAAHHSAIQFKALQCNTMQCSVVRCSAVQYSTESCSAVNVQCRKFSAVHCSGMQCSKCSQALQCGAV